MLICKGTVYCLNLFISIVLYCGAIQIDVSPRSAVAFIGEEVTFHCHYNGSFDIPLWRINGQRYYFPDSLPQFHSSRIISLTVSKAQLYMDGWEYICFLIILANGTQSFAESSPAYLTVKNYTVYTSANVSMMTPTTIVQSGNKDVASAVTTVTVSVDATKATAYKSALPKESLQVREAERDGQQSTVYIAVGAGVFSVAVLILIIVCVMILVKLRSLRLSSQAQCRAVKKETGPIYDQIQDNHEEPVYEVLETNQGDVACTNPHQLHNVRETCAAEEVDSSTSISSDHGSAIHLQQYSVVSFKDADPEPVYDEALKRIHTVAYMTPIQLPMATSTRDMVEEVSGNTSLCTGSTIHLQHCPAYKLIGGKLQ